MSTITWTKEQLQAIESRDGALLVSAAAGSGKTAVLVERLLRRVCEEGKNIDQFLMITYTKAAAAELRTKILAALAEKIAEDPGNRHIVKQMTYVHRAQISTIHAYCTQILRTHGHILGLATDFKIIDENEAEILRRQVLEDLLEEEYEADRPEFAEFCNALSGERDDTKMEETILTLHLKSRSHPNPNQWLIDCCKAYQVKGVLDVQDTRWGKELIGYIHEICSYLQKRLKNVCFEMQGDSALEAAYGPAFLSDIQNLQQICSTTQWDEMLAIVHTMEFMRLSSIRKCENPELKEWAQEERNNVKGEIKKIGERLLCKDSNTILKELYELYPIVYELCQLVSALDIRYREKKRQRGVLDYSDLEHETMALVVQEYCEQDDIVVPTVLAKELSEEFCEIMVDEYQDSNCLQDVIFRAVSQEEKNLTMVGDLKQSIYRFRLADPTIFLHKYQTFEDYENAMPGQPRVVNLSRNFRSRKEILQCCNDYFSQMMSPCMGELQYTKREYLNQGAAYPEQNADYRSELVLLDLTDDKEREEGELPPHAREVEARYIASRIQEMIKQKYPIDGRPIQYRDIVILLRSQTGRVEIYEQALREYGIPCFADQKAGLLGTLEVGILISFLQIIDNPLWDVPLVSTLRSPMFGFTADDLAEIRQTKSGFFYHALLLTAKGESLCSKKCRKFLEILSDLRDLASEVPTDLLIWQLLDRTGARGLFGAMEEGEIRIQHLLALYQYAQQFEKNGYRGLHAFLNHIAHITAQGGDIPTGKYEHAGEAVRIMSIHTSKGLEFPVVFLADCNRMFNRMDLQAQVLIHPCFGIGLNYRDQKMRYECPSIARMCIELQLEREMKSEELRVIYVAMTRAKEKMIVVCTEKDAEKRMKLAQNLVYEGEISPITLLKASRADLWFLLPQCARQSTFLLRNVLKDAFPDPDDYQTVTRIHSEPEKWKIDELTNRFSYHYPYEEAVYTEGKLTATGLAQEGLARRRHFVRPHFVQERGLTATERGIALHLAMQLIDFEKCTSKAGIEEELLRLKTEQFLTSEQIAVVSANKLEAFFVSDLGKSVRKSSHVWREFHFSRLIPVSDEDTALLQGVVDLIFEEENALVLVDFKSDRRIEPKNIAQYTRQLNIYADALQSIMGQPIARKVLFFLNHGKSVEC